MIHVKKHPSKINTLRLSIAELDKSYEGYRIKIDEGEWIELEENEIKQVNLYPKSAYKVEGQVKDNGKWVDVHGAWLANDQAWLHQKGGYRDES